jgi:hypothetical protein
MIIKPLGPEEESVYRRLAPAIGLVAGLAPAVFPALAHAQVNIDQGKSPAEIYSSDCATCHKTPRGLAAGRNTLMLSAFLREHYTASPDQAGALAAYVLGAGGAEPAPKQKPEAEHARAEEPSAAEPKPATHPIRAAAKPEEDKRPKQQEAKREERPASPAGAEKRQAAPQTASREVKREPVPVNAAPAAPEPAPVAATPAANAAPSAAVQSPNPVTSPELSPTTSAAVPAEEEPSAGAAVPRDNIPD